MPSNLQEKTLPDNVTVAIADVGAAAREAKNYLYRIALHLVNKLEGLTQKTGAYSELLAALPKDSPLASGCQAKLIEAESELASERQAKLIEAEVASIAETPLEEELVVKVEATNSAIMLLSRNKEKQQLQQQLTSGVEKALSYDLKSSKKDLMHTSKKDLETYQGRLTALSEVNPYIKRVLLAHVERTNTFIEYSEAKTKEAEVRAAAEAIVQFMNNFDKNPHLLVEAINQIPALLNHSASCPDLSGDIWGSINAAITSCYEVIEGKVENELPKDAKDLQDITDEMRLLQEIVNKSFNEFKAQIKKSDNDLYIYITADESLENSLSIIGRKLKAVDKALIAADVAGEKLTDPENSDSDTESDGFEVGAAALTVLAPEPVIAPAKALIAANVAGKNLTDSENSYSDTNSLSSSGTTGSEQGTPDEGEGEGELEEAQAREAEAQAQARAAEQRIAEAKAEAEAEALIATEVARELARTAEEARAEARVAALTLRQSLTSHFDKKADAFVLKKLIAEAEILLKTETKDPKTVKAILDVHDRILDAADGEPEIPQLLDRLIERANKIMDDSTPTYQKPPTAVREADDDIESRLARTAIIRGKAQDLLEKGVDDDNVGDLFRVEAELASYNTDPMLTRNMADASSEHLHAWLSRSRKNQAIQNVAAVTMDRIAHKAKIELHQQADHAIAQFINQLKDESITLPSIVSNISILLGPFFKSCPELASKLNRAINWTIRRSCEDKKPSLNDIEAALAELKTVDKPYHADSKKILDAVVAEQVRANTRARANIRAEAAEKRAATAAKKPIAAKKPARGVSAEERIRANTRAEAAEKRAATAAKKPIAAKKPARGVSAEERIRANTRAEAAEARAEVAKLAESEALIAEAEVAEVAAEIAADSNTGVSPEGSINHDPVPARVEATATAAPAETGVSTADPINDDIVPATAQTDEKLYIQKTAIGEAVNTPQTAERLQAEDKIAEVPEARTAEAETIHKPMIAMGLITVGLIIAAVATAAATAGILPLVFMIGAAIAAIATNVTANMAAKPLEEVTNGTTPPLANSL